MNHSKFVEKYHSGEIKVNINKFDAKQLLINDQMPKKYVNADVFWSWVWILALVGGLILFFIYSKLLGAIIFIIGLILPGRQKESAMQFVLEYALENEEFFEMVKSEHILLTQDNE